MGCCFSKKAEREQEPNATTPLLRDEGPIIVCPGPLTTNQAYLEWNLIIDRAAKKMINTFPSMNPLHPDEVNERRKKYTEILSLVKPRPLLSMESLHQQDLSAVVGLLTEAKPYQDTSLSSHMLLVGRALKQTLTVHGEIIVHLQPIRSHRQSRSSLSY